MVRLRLAKLRDAPGVRQTHIGRPKEWGLGQLEFVRLGSDF